MSHWTTRFTPRQQVQGLDDLEDILNSPSPALGPTSFDPGHLPAANPSQQVGSSLAVSCEAAQPDLLPKGHRHATRDAIESQKASVWSTAYQSASAPLAAVWARIPQQLQNFPSLKASDVGSGNQSTFNSQYLLDLMARNKAATAAATVAGAAAGGAVAGPFGMAAGAKTGALMVAVGAAAAGAAQHYYLPVALDKPVAASPSPQPCTNSQTSGAGGLS